MVLDGPMTRILVSCLTALSIWVLSGLTEWENNQEILTGIPSGGIMIIHFQASS